MTDAEKHRKELQNAVMEFMVNPNSRNQMVLERAMRMYQTTTTAVEEAGAGPILWPPVEMDGKLGRESR